MDRNNVQDFLKFAKGILPYSYAQHLQDLWALWETGFKLKKAYYIEFGALNGKDFSNSYVMEKLGWDGVVAEPHPSYVDRVKQNRKCYFSTKCVFDKTGETVTFHMVRGRPAMSSIGTHMTQDDKIHLRENYVEHDVETITLVDLLKEASAPKDIDFLSIDTEGSELAILKAFDFDLYNIRLICVEHNDVMREDLYNLLTSKGYIRKFTEISGHDDYYVREGAYPDWSNKTQEKMEKKLSKIPVFENQLDKRVVLLDSLIAKTS